MFGLALSRRLAAAAVVGFLVLHAGASWAYWRGAVVWVREAVDVAELALPRLYFCPAGAGHRARTRAWAAYDCRLRFQEEERECRARPVDSGPDVTTQGRCLEFDSDALAVRTEWSAAWNELWLHAAFEEEEALPDTLELEEVELGVRYQEWRPGEPGLDESAGTLPTLAARAL